VGLLVHTFDADFTPCVEIGWRLAFEHWGKGYATEAGRLAIGFGFEESGDEIVSFTVPANSRSIAVMERLGMTHAGEFEHPRLPPGHRLAGTSSIASASSRRGRGSAPDPCGLPTF
jgi:RimJ/RimL family protein N-acetyltransferase